MDASTAILLAKVDLLDAFIASAGGSVVIPRQVKEECFGRDSLDSRLIARAIEEGKLVVKAANQRMTDRMSSDFGLGAGEAAVLALAVANQGAIVVTDDRRAIRVCRVMRLGFLTALAILTALKQRGVLSGPEAIRKLETLSREGRYKSEMIAAARRDLEA